MYAGPIADGIAAVTAFFLGRHEFIQMQKLETSQDSSETAAAVPR